MKKKILFSIITPIYKGEKYINRYFNSIKNIIFNKNNFEIIFILDGKDKKILKKIEKKIHLWPNKKIIINENRIGPGMSRNKGLRLSKGKYILFLDFDDELKKNALKILESSTNHNPDFIGYNFQKNSKRIIKDYRKDFKFICKTRYKRIKNFLMGEIDGSVIFSCIKREVIIDNRIYFKKELHEDIFFIFQVYYFSKKFILLNKSLAIKNDEKSSIVNNINQFAIKGYLKQPNRIRDFLILKKFNFKKLEKYYIRGFIGYSAHLILSSFKIKNFNLKKQNYRLIKKILLLNNSFMNYKFMTFKDNVVNIFVKHFYKKNIVRKNITIFEDMVLKIYEKNL